jgi:hypothetical protein
MNLKIGKGLMPMMRQIKFEELRGVEQSGSSLGS